MLIDSKDTNKYIREKARKHLYELSLKSIESLRDIPELEEPTYEQEQWLNRKMKSRRPS